MLNGTWEIKNPFSGQVLNSFTFREDGTYRYYSQNAGTINSTYTISGNTIMYANGTSNRYELSGGNLYLDGNLLTKA